MVAFGLGLALGPATRGVPAAQWGLGQLGGATAGNGGLMDFNVQQWSCSRFYRWLNTAEEWPLQPDADGNPSCRMENEGFVLAVQSRIDQQVLQGTVPATGFWFNDSRFNVIGMLTVTVGYPEQPLWYLEAPLGAVDSLAIARLLPLAWSNLLQPVMRSFVMSIRRCLGSGLEAESQADVAQGAVDAAEAALIDAEEVGEIVISLDVGVGAVIGIAILVALPFLLSRLFHVTYHNLRVYNLTTFDFAWQVMIEDGSMSAYPVGANDTTAPDYVIPAMMSFAPPGLMPVPVATEADFSFASSSEETGISYGMQFVATLPNGEAAGEIVASIAVPYWGDNRIGIDNAAEPRLATGGQCSFNGVVLDLYLSIDALQGEMPTPSGAMAYMYNSVIIFYEGPERQTGA